MKWLYKLEYKFRRFGIPSLMLYVTVTMLAGYLLEAIVGIPVTYYLMFSRTLILQGEVWRLLSFVFMPPATDFLWLFFALYFFYFIGNSLENAWGAFRFTVFYLCGILGAIAAGFIAGYNTNIYLNLTLFLAFAQLFPDQEVLLFFLLPIKVKYLGYLNWALILYNFIRGGMVTRVTIAFSLLNFFLFFGGDLYRRARDFTKYHKNRRNFKKQSQQYRDYWR